MNVIEQKRQVLPATNMSYHPVIRFIARVISVIFHPLFIPVYVSWFLIYIYQIFPAFTGWDKSLLLIRFLVMYALFPLATILLAKALGFVQTIFLRNQKDRIIPYIACGLYYFWMWYVLKNQPQIPTEVVMFSLAIFLASSIGLILNIYMKVSMHALAVGVAVAFMLLLGFTTYLNLGPYISITLLIGGLVCTSRLINSDHNPWEVYFGFAAGVLAQIIAYLFV
ncbi:hypothetical protein OCK74_24835 [Chitinophagaceae bacterium LB-8]|uniref:Phosphatase PAP2 family protein n=1 Tax=Paraflavisolibacter caeni TaxID=2982496 RepID=A0A9X3BHH5_9BACT|nr:hypothetical protein [Paraflavisolibacter caeni]MCU7552369.1 hypothetical protein [Paraflavisolibacter caeni]